MIQTTKIEIRFFFNKKRETIKNLVKVHCQELKQTGYACNFKSKISSNAFLSPNSTKT